MAKREKRKGYRGENEVERLLKAQGIEAKRVPLSGADSFQKGDILLEPGVSAEVKRRKRINSLFYDVLQEFNIAFVRADRRPWIVLMDFDFFCSLWRKANGCF